MQQIDQKLIICFLSLIVTITGLEKFPHVSYLSLSCPAVKKLAKVASASIFWFESGVTKSLKFEVTRIIPFTLSMPSHLCHLF